MTEVEIPAVVTEVSTTIPPVIVNEVELKGEEKRIVEETQIPKKEESKEEIPIEKTTAPERNTRKKGFRRSWMKNYYKRNHKKEKTSVGNKKEDPINKEVYLPLEYDTPPIENVVLDYSGNVNTRENRIDFSKSNWYAQFQYYRDLLGKQSSLEEELDELAKRSGEESDGLLSLNYGIFSNACINRESRCINLYGETGKTLPERIRHRFQSNDFYCESFLQIY